MLYRAYQTQCDALVPMRMLAELTLSAASHLPRPVADNLFVRHGIAAYETIARSGLTHERPAFGIDHVLVGDQPAEVREETRRLSPFLDLVHFTKPGVAPGPRVLLVAPLAGHFSTLLRETVRTLLGEHDVYLTDWRNARDIPLGDGRFGFDEYVGHIVYTLELLGPGTHVVAVCQPCVPALAATALLAAGAATRSPAASRSWPAPSTPGSTPPRSTRWRRAGR